MKSLKVMKVQCATCPFRVGGWVEVQDLLVHRALNTGIPICHSTGPHSLVPKKKRVSSKPLACRGARNLQLQLFVALGFMDEPTDQAWEKKANEIKSRSR